MKEERKGGILKRRGEPSRKVDKEHPIEQLTIKEILDINEKTASQVIDYLPQQQIRKIKTMHSSQATFQIINGAIEIVNQAIRPELNNNGKEQLLSIHNIFMHNVHQSLESEWKGRRELASTLSKSQFKENPRDIIAKQNAVLYQEEIREMQDTFERKQKFKEYADEHLMQDKDELEEIIKERAGKVTEEVINERFVKYYRERKIKEEAVLEEHAKRSSSEGLESFKLMIEGSRIEGELRKALRMEKLELEVIDKDRTCRQMGSNIGYFLNMQTCLLDQS